MSSSNVDSATVADCSSGCGVDLSRDKNQSSSDRDYRSRKEKRSREDNISDRRERKDKKSHREKDSHERRKHHKHSKERKDKKDSKHSHHSDHRKSKKYHKEKRRHHHSSSSSNGDSGYDSDCSDTDSCDDGALRSSITGKRIKLHREKSLADRMNDLQREALRHRMNSQF